MDADQPDEQSDHVLVSRSDWREIMMRVDRIAATLEASKQALSCAAAPRRSVAARRLPTRDLTG